ncbi:MAG: PepSY domain-containing protein [Sphingobium sp.]
MGRFALIKSGKRWLYWSHRWLGILTCLFFLLWFVSGIVMMYVPYPSVTAQERLATLAPIDWGRVAVGPTRAMQIARQDAFPGELRLDMAAGEPAWRIRAGKDRIALSAVNGRILSAPDEASAVAAARRFAGGAAVARVERIEDDQWTVAQGFKWARPLWKVALADDAGTELYVASTTGEVVQNTTAQERMWNWAGAVPHWLYFSIVRRDGAFWRQVVLWTSGPAIIGGVTGLWIGILRMRLRHYKNGSVSPYRGWMKWHHVAGLIGGLFAITWMFSGWLSVNPFEWFARNGPSGGPALYAAHERADFPDLDIARFAERAKPAREVRLSWIAGQPVVTMSGPDDSTVGIARPDGAPLAFTRSELLANARRLMPDVPVREAVWLTEPDLYWYSHGHDRPLPVLRVIFADAEGTWATLDPKTGALLGQQNASGRSYRWLFSALHDFDLPFLLANRVLRDPLMWLLSGFGIIMSLSGVVIGWRHLVHRRKRSLAIRRRLRTSQSSS